MVAINDTEKKIQTNRLTYTTQILKKRVQLLKAKIYIYDID